jgi:hypothetical protein
MGDFSGVGVGGMNGVDALKKLRDGEAKQIQYSDRLITITHKDLVDSYSQFHFLVEIYQSEYDKFAIHEVLNDIIMSDEWEVVENGS